MRKAFYLIIEGIDGTGKTTLSKKLKAYFESKNKKVYLTKEPTNEKWGSLIREKALHSKMTAEEEVELFVKDRQQHMEELIKPKLKEDCIIIQDRSFISSAAYQTAHIDSPYSIQEILEINKFAEIPTLAILLDLSVGKALVRINKDRTDIYSNFENKERLEKTRKSYLNVFNLLNDKFHFVKINADKNEEELKNEVVYFIEKISWPSEELDPSDFIDEEPNDDNYISYEE